MENNKNNIDKYFRKLSEEQEPKAFKNMDAIWDKVEEKLDQKKKKRVIPFWKYAGIAAAVLVLITVGSRFINQNPTVQNSESETTDIVLIEEEKIQEEFDSLHDSDDVVAFELSMPENKESHHVTKREITQDKKIIQEVVKYSSPIISETIVESEIVLENTHSEMSLESNEGKDIESYKLAEKRNDSFVSALKGNTSGVVINTGSGLPGSGATVRIRGTHFLSTESQNYYDKHTNGFFERSNESYENFTENQFESAQSNPVSTFSIDVDNASYTNIRRFINNGQTVPKDAVRIEEMVNFFNYDYPKPTGEHPFSIHTEYSDAPWNPNHKLLKIGLQGKEIPTDKLPKSNFVFLVDVSGSMSDTNKLPLLKSSMKVLLDELRDEDRVSIVYYANNVGVLLEPTKAKEKKKIIEVIDTMTASGGTSGGAGLELAYEMAEKHFVKGGNNRIILATDGDFNIGKSSDSEMQQLIEEKRKSGVFLTCLGFGMGNYKDSKMITLSKKGNGNYAYIDNIQEANRFLGKEFKGSMYAIAKDVKIQIEFNPTHVQAYRLIGYEMRKLRNEDFTNDAIDAGELGSGHTVTALYEIIPNGVKSEFYNYENDLKYTSTNTVAGRYQNELATIKFRYKKPDGDKSIEMIHTVPNQKTALQNASKDFKFASAVAWFGLKLRDSQLIPNKESKEIIKLAKDGLHNDADGYKAEFIRLVNSVK